MALRFEEGNIERREHDLYSRNAPDRPEDKRGNFTKPDYDVPRQWQPDKEKKKNIFNFSSTQKTGFFKKFFIGSIAIFVIAIGTFLYMSFGGFNAVSSKNVDISVQGPVAIDGGEELVLDISITNNNNVALQDTELRFEYPEGTRQAGNLSIELIRSNEEIGMIAPGESVTKTVKAVLFGEKESVKQIKVSVDYKAQGSNATFTKDKNYEIGIKSAPVVFSVDYPKEVNSNQEMELVVNITSNSNTPIQNLLVRAEYPFGFAFAQADPNPTFDNNIWNIGDLKPKEKRVIKIRGKIEGQNDEERTFRLSAGTAMPGDEKMIGITLVSSAQSILIRKPFFDITFSLDGDPNENHVADIDDSVGALISWKNNLPTDVDDVSLSVEVGGNALDRTNILVGQQGFYQSVNNTIQWDKRVFPEFFKIAPGVSGTLNFDFHTVKPTSQTLATLRNPTITFKVLMKGMRLLDNKPSETISYSFTRNVKVSTQAVFNPRLVYSTGPFTNTGAIPPKAEKETTYTVIWTLSNAFNDLNNVSVSAELPPYVTWRNIKSPTTESVIYNPTTNKVIWEPGAIKAGVGFVSSPREVAFQLGFLPSLGQVGTAPVILGEATFRGTDTFTGREILVTKAPLTTRITTDPSFDVNDDFVVN